MPAYMPLRVLVVLAAVALPNVPLAGSALGPVHAQTPEAAAIGTVYAAPGKRVLVRRTNRAGRYAMIWLQNGMMESSAMNDPILVERYSFGWQALDVVNFGCRPTGHGIDVETAHALMRGLPARVNHRPCVEMESDIGPADQIEAVREIERGSGLHPWVAVSGGYALADWYGGGGGEHLYARRRGRWTLIAGGGGSMDAGILRAFGVPMAASCELAGWSASGPACPARKRSLRRSTTEHRPRR
jgi:hypothetical protein